VGPGWKIFVLKFDVGGIFIAVFEGLECVFGNIELGTGRGGLVEWEF